MSKQHRVAALLLALVLLLSACGRGKDPEAGLSSSSIEESTTFAVSSKDASASKGGLPAGGESSRPSADAQGQWIETKTGRIYKGEGSFYHTFDTVIGLTFYAESPEAFRDYYDFAVEEFERLHRLYDNYAPYEGVANVYTINQQAGKKAVAVEDDLFNLIRFAVDNYEKVDGKVNIAMGSVLQLWHQAQEEAARRQEAQEGHGALDGGGSGEETSAGSLPSLLPSRQALEEAAKHTDIRKLKLDGEKKTVYLQDPAMSLDLGAVAKGWAAELVGRELEEKGLSSGIINAGGNVRTVGLPPDGRTEWKVGIQDPRPRDAQLIAAVSLGNNQSAVTSGDYQRYFIEEGKRYCHIIDPRTLMPRDDITSVTVLTSHSGLADLLSTSLFLSTEEERQAILSRFSEEVGYVWIDQEDKLHSNEKMEGKLESLQ